MFAAEQNASRLAGRVGYINNTLFRPRRNTDHASQFHGSRSRLLSRPFAAAFLGRRTVALFFQLRKRLHGMFQLRVTFIRNSHHIPQYCVRIKVLLFATQRVKDGDLQ